MVYADTNVLYPYYISDLLLWLSADGVIRLIWTRYLIDEIVQVVPRGRSGRGRDERSVRSQWEAVRVFLGRDEVTEQEWRTKLHLATGPDVDDYPHQAAAIFARADVLITHDRTGFPSSNLDRHGVKVTGVDDFLCLLWESCPRELLAAVASRVDGLARPPMTLSQYVKTIATAAPRFADIVMSSLPSP